MELGQKLRQARLDMGLSQRQLCGDEITRNMLSQIENGTARPSMDTLRFLAKRLEKPISYFLEEQTVTSPNQSVMEQARLAFGAKDFALTLERIKDYREPDPVFDWEKGILAALACMELAEQVIAGGRMPYAMELLEQAAQAESVTPYYDKALERRRLLLLSEIKSVAMPADDRELLLRAKAALAEGDHRRAARYLDAAEDQTATQWNYLRGKAYLEQGQYTDALRCLQAAEQRYPKECAAWLERCCRELEDFKGAYYYACKRRELEG